MDVPSLKMDTTEQLNKVLQHYQLVSMNTLGGPAALWRSEMAKLKMAAGNELGFTSTVGNRYDSTRFKDVKVSSEVSVRRKDSHQLPYDFKHPSSYASSVQQVPLLMQADSHACRQTETLLDNHIIACFEVGGEKRLCLPQVLKTVLNNFDLSVINQVCDELQIYLPRCSNEQLTAWKESGMLPTAAPSCGLITKTDAERLCSALLDGEPAVNLVKSEPRISELPSPKRIPVYHECFGVGYGYLMTELALSTEAACVKCVDCEKVLSINLFISHSHRHKENTICHWGFDRKNWKQYLRYAEEAVAEEELRVVLQNVFNRTVERIAQSGGRKRKDGSIDSDDTTPVKVYRSNCEKEVGQHANEAASLQTSSVAGSSSSPQRLPYPTNASHSDTAQSLSAVSQSLPAYAKDQPVLADPDRVVPSSESHRYEKHFVPNISLKPSCQTKEDNASAEDPADQKVVKQPRQRMYSSDSGTSTSDEESSLLEDAPLYELHRLFGRLLGSSSLADSEKLRYQLEYDALHGKLQRLLCPSAAS